jgi:hypothetical protein
METLSSMALELFVCEVGIIVSVNTQHLGTVLATGGDLLQTGVPGYYRMESSRSGISRLPGRSPAEGEKTTGRDIGRLRGVPAFS